MKRSLDANFKMTVINAAKTYGVTEYNVPEMVSSKRPCLLQCVLLFSNITQTNTLSLSQVLKLSFERGRGSSIVRVLYLSQCGTQLVIFIITSDSLLI